MARSSTTPAWQVAIIVLTTNVVGVIVLSVLYLAQSICIPLALAIFFAFLLNPLVSALKRFRVPKLPAILLAMSTVVLIVGGIGWIVGAEARSMVEEAPQYSQNVKAKMRSLRQILPMSKMPEMENMFNDATSGQEAAPESAREKARSRVQVVVRSEFPSWLTSLTSLLERFAEALAGLVLSLVLLLFVLLKKEDLRNRLIRLMGDGSITATTKAFEDASQRISRYLLLQFIVNGAFGITITLGLLLIQVRYAPLWGFLGFVLRYVPYIGPWIAALPPILISLAMFPGWTEPLLVLTLFAVVELVTGNFIEPRLYGRSIGISEVALLVAAAFWAFLWGPVGLILSSPLTVCLMVLGKYVPRLEFLDIMLSDEPVLPPDVAFYQRLLARDQDEAADLALAQAKTSSAKNVYDDLLVPALNFAKRDRERDDLTDEDEQFVLRSTAEILEEVDERNTAARPAALQKDSQTMKVRVVACPARDQIDLLGLTMLSRLVDSEKWDLEIIAVETLTSELIARVSEEEPLMVCIGSLPPGGLAHTRYLCKRLRMHFPDLKIIVGRWGIGANLPSNRDQLHEAGADLVSGTLLETVGQLNSLLPVLMQRQQRRAAIA
jgi:predicted PurR-regulated permease PerM